MNRLMILDAHRLVFPAINFQKINNSTISRGGKVFRILILDKKK